MTDTLGILAGGGPLPRKLVETCKARNQSVFVVAFEGHTEPATVEGVAHSWVRLGAALDALEPLQAAGVRRLTMVGPIKRPGLKELRPDFRTVKFLAKVGAQSLGDDGLLTSILKDLEARGFEMIGADQIMDDFLARHGCYGRHEPNEQARADIARGVAVVQALGKVDVGQAAVVQEGIVLGVEAAEGTDELLRRCKALRREGAGGVLVKIKKPGQEDRADMPTIGLKTLQGAIDAGLSGIAVEAGGTLVIDAELLSEAADEAGLFVMGIEVSA